MASTPPYKPQGSSDRFEARNGRMVEFWLLGQRWTAVYRYTRVDLLHLPIMFPAEPFVVEPTIFYPDGRMRRYGGRRFRAEPTPDDFVEHVFGLLQGLAVRDEIDLETRISPPVGEIRYSARIL